MTEVEHSVGKGEPVVAVALNPPAGTAGWPVTTYRDTTIYRVLIRKGWSESDIEAACQPSTPGGSK